MTRGESTGRGAPPAVLRRDPVVGQRGGEGALLLGEARGEVVGQTVPGARAHCWYYTGPATAPSGGEKKPLQTFATWSIIKADSEIEQICGVIADAYKIAPQQNLFDGAVRLPALASDQTSGLKGGVWAPVIPDCFEYLEPRAAMEIHCRGISSMPNVSLDGHIYQRTRVHEGGAAEMCVVPVSMQDESARNVGEISGLDLSWMVPVGQEWRLHLDLACWAWSVPSLMVPIDYTEAWIGQTDFGTVMTYAAVGLWRYHNALASDKKMEAPLGQSETQQILLTAKGSLRGYSDVSSWKHRYMAGSFPIGGEQVTGALIPPGEFNVVMGAVASVDWSGPKPGTYHQIAQDTGDQQVQLSLTPMAYDPSVATLKLSEAIKQKLKGVDVIRLSTEWSGVTAFFGDGETFAYGELPSIYEPHSMISYIAQMQAIEVNMINGLNGKKDKYTHIFTDGLTGISYAATDEFVTLRVRYFASTSMRSADRTSEYCVEPCVMWQPRAAVTPQPAAGGLSSWTFPTVMHLSPDIDAMTQNVNGTIPKQITLTIDNDKSGYSIEVARCRRPCLYSNTKQGSWHPLTCFQDLPHAYIGLPQNKVTLQFDDQPILELQSDGNIPALSLIESGDHEVLWSTTDYARFVNQSTQGVEIAEAIWGTSPLVEPLAVHTGNAAIVVTMPRSIDHLSDKDNGTLRGGVLSFGSDLKYDCDDATGFCGQSANGRYSSISDCKRNTTCKYTYGQFVRSDASGGTSGNSEWPSSHKGGGSGTHPGSDTPGDQLKVNWKNIALVVLIICVGCIVVYFVLRRPAPAEAPPGAPPGAPPVDAMAGVAPPPTPAPPAGMDLPM